MAIAFRPNGPTVFVLCSTAAQPAVQAPSAENVATQNYVVTNNGTVIAFLSMQQSSTAALSAATTPSQGVTSSVYPVLNGSQVTLTGPPNAWFSAIGTATSAIYVTPGYGQ